jgi:hypothetical protein
VFTNQITFYQTKYFLDIFTNYAMLLQFSEFTRQERHTLAPMLGELSIKIVIADCLQVHADVVTYFVDRNMLPVGAVSEQILFVGGQEVVQNQLEIAQVNSPSSSF